MASLYSRIAAVSRGACLTGRLAGLLLAGSLALAAPAAADEMPTNGDLAAIRTMIDSQIAAFRADDGDKAWSYAAPLLQQIFGDPATFMNMVKQGYQPVYRPKAVTFGQLRETPKGLMQEVFLVGPDGADWTALYVVERQPDGSWRIAGCKLAKQERVSA